MPEYGIGGELEVAEVPIIFWLAIWGAKTGRADVAPSLGAGEAQVSGSPAARSL